MRLETSLAKRLALSLTVLWLAVICVLSVFGAEPNEVTNDAVSSAKSNEDVRHVAQYRGPVDVALTADERWAVTANELSHTVSLIDLQSRLPTHEIGVGKRPNCIMRLTDNEFLVSCRDSGLLVRLGIRDGRLVRLAEIEIGFEPLGIAASGHDRAFVSLRATGELAEVDLVANQVVRRFEVGRWPSFLAISKDGKRIAVGLAGESQIAVVDADKGEVLYTEPLSGGINLGHLQLSANGQQVYFPWMVYRTNPITVRDIQRGWVLASRVARIRMDGPAYREAISLDVPRLAVADPYGLDITPDEHRLAVTSSGTHELLVYRLGDLPFIGAGGPGDLIDQRLLNDRDLFYRIELGGRPMGLVCSSDNVTAIVANQSLDTLQLVDLESRQVVQSISLGEPSPDPEVQLVHQGMEIFYDARRSLDQWYSCHSCHQDGGTNSKAMDTWNDGTELTTKTVLALYGVTETAPWTWHGWQGDLDDSLQNSFVSTMKGERASDGDIDALRAYLEQLDAPPNPFVGGDGEISAAAQRGRELFQRSDVGCADCHSGPRFTDGQIHDVGMTREADAYEGYNTPSLIGVYRKPRLLHDGRSKTLESVLTKWHKPDEIGGGAELDEKQVADLIEYLKTL